MPFWASPSTDVRLRYMVPAVAASAGGCVGGDSDVVNMPLFQRVLVVAASAGGVGNNGKQTHRMLYGSGCRCFCSWRRCVVHTLFCGVLVVAASVGGAASAAVSVGDGVCIPRTPLSVPAGVVVHFIVVDDVDTVTSR